MKAVLAFVEMDLTYYFLPCYNVTSFKVVHILPHNAVKVNSWEAYTATVYSSAGEQIKASA